MDYLKKYKKHLFIGFILGFSILVAILFISDFKSVVTVFSQMNLTFLPFIFLLAPLNYLLRFLKWNYYCKLSGIRPDPKMNGFIFMSGLCMTITPGKIGELLKCYLLKEHIGTPISKSSSIVMAERITDGVAMVILASFGLLSYPFGKTTIILSSLFLLFAIAIFRIQPVFSFFMRGFHKVKFLEGFINFLNAFQNSAKTLFSPSPLIVAILIGIISWGFEGIIVFLAILAFGGSISILGSLFVVSVSSLLGALSFLPGGLGVAEGSIMGILILTGVQTETAAATTLITRVSTLWLGVLIGLIGLVFAQKELSRGR
jgi:glycosyltransferase 2 family protein